MKLIHEKTGREVETGEVLHAFNGKAVTLISMRAPEHKGKAGYVFVKEMSESGFCGEYYVSVFGLKWV